MYISIVDPGNIGESYPGERMRFNKDNLRSFMLDYCSDNAVANVFHSNYSEEIEGQYHIENGLLIWEQG